MTQMTGIIAAFIAGGWMLTPPANLAGAGRTVAEAPVAAPQEMAVVTWTPANPVAGTIVKITVAFDPSLPVASITGSIAGERLHFLPAGEGELEALAGIPIDAASKLTVPLHVRHVSGRAQTINSEVEVARGEYRLEKLTVAPVFGGPPDAVAAARMARDRELAAAVSRNAHSTPKLWDGEFAIPRNTRITSGFGHGREFNGNVQSRHMGVDFAGAVGTPIVAPNRGVVALVEEFHLAGNVVYLDHGAGLITGYFHLSEATVAAGDTVERGQQIGKVGATGRVTGPHLHWVARYGAISVNPLTLPGITRREGDSVGR